MFLINLNADIVACILSFRTSRHKPNLENTSKYGSEHAHASYPGLFFRPPGFSPFMGREERRVQGLDYLIQCCVGAVVCAVEEIEKSTLFGGKEGGGEMFPRREKSNFTAKCFNTFALIVALQVLFFLRMLRFSFLHKTIISKFQFTWMEHATENRLG